VPSYRHTQIGYVTLGALIAALGAMSWTLRPGGYTAGEVGLLLLLGAAAILFSVLTVEITPEALRVLFGPGLIRRSIPLQEIESAKVIRVPWYVGWGMRWTGYWLYNVSGRMAVLLYLRRGHAFGVGTDEPEALLAALRRAGVATDTRPAART
jgi:uncharacterized YccA/Bax inhibitor family protein